MYSIVLRPDEKNRRGSKMKLLLFIASCSIVIFSTLNVHATETKEYKSSGQVGFFGEYIYPEEELVPGVDRDIEQKAGKKIEKIIVAENSVTLPETGDTLSLHDQWIGFVLVGLAFLLLKRNKNNGGSVKCN
ncbi:LPXTG cell wall anchor domain-containing protein [Listeria sp. SHR_NRA_18]|nr:LPXTG cell wall anchor domain-containing protein [Listeria sp. SHR_NRA_18]